MPVSKSFIYTDKDGNSETIKFGTEASHVDVDGQDLKTMIDETLVKNTDYATTTSAGVVKFHTSGGNGVGKNVSGLLTDANNEIYVNTNESCGTTRNDSGAITIVPATETDIDNTGTSNANNRRPITCYNLDYALSKRLAKGVVASAKITNLSVENLTVTDLIEGNISSDYIHADEIEVNDLKASDISVSGNLELYAGVPNMSLSEIKALFENQTYFNARFITPNSGKLVALNGATFPVTDGPDIISRYAMSFTTMNLDVLFDSRSNSSTDFKYKILIALSVPGTTERVDYITLFNGNLIIQRNGAYGFRIIAKKGTNGNSSAITDNSIITSTGPIILAVSGGVAVGTITLSAYKLDVNLGLSSTIQTATATLDQQQYVGTYDDTKNFIKTPTNAEVYGMYIECGNSVSAVTLDVLATNLAKSIKLGGNGSVTTDGDIRDIREQVRNLSIKHVNITDCEYTDGGDGGYMLPDGLMILNMNSSAIDTTDAIPAHPTSYDYNFSQIVQSGRSYLCEVTTHPTVANANGYVTVYGELGVNTVKNVMNCRTPSNTNNKVITTNPDFELYDGAELYINFGVGSFSSSFFDLRNGDITLNINNIGAYPVYFNGIDGFSQLCDESTDSDYSIPLSGYMHVIYSEEIEAYIYMDGLSMVWYSYLSDNALKLYDSVNLDGIETKLDVNTAITHYAVCDTDKSETTKVISIPGWRMVNGAQVYVRFTDDNPLILDDGKTVYELKINDNEPKTMILNDAGDSISFLTYNTSSWMGGDGTLSFYGLMHLVYDEKEDVFYFVNGYSEHSATSDMATVAMALEANPNIAGVDFNGYSTVSYSAIAKTETGGNVNHKKINIPNWKLVDGAQAFIYIPNSEAFNVNTINASDYTLNINNTGDKPIYINSSGDGLPGLSVFSEFAGMIHVIYSSKADGYMYIGGLDNGYASQADSLADRHTIDGVEFSGNNDVSHYGIVDATTASGNINSKTVDIEGWNLVDGARADIYIPEGRGYDLTDTDNSDYLNISNTGYKALVINNARDDLYCLTPENPKSLCGLISVVYVKTLDSYMVINAGGNIDRSNFSNTSEYAESSNKAHKLDGITIINGLGFNGTADVSSYATCDTASNVHDKVVVADTNFALVDGAQLYIEFKNSIAYESGKNMRLIVNGNEAKNVMVNITDSLYSDLEYMTFDEVPAGSVMHVVYNQTDDKFLYIGGLDIAYFAAAVPWSGIAGAETATTSKDGLMSKTDKSNLDTLKNNAIKPVVLGTRGLQFANCISGAVKATMYAPNSLPSTTNVDMVPIVNRNGSDVNKSTWSWKALSEITGGTSPISSIDKNNNKGITITGSDDTEYNIFAPTSAPANDTKQYVPIYSTGASASSGSWKWQETTDAGIVNSFSGSPVQIGVWVDGKTPVWRLAFQHQFTTAEISDIKESSDFDIGTLVPCTNSNYFFILNYTGFFSYYTDSPCYIDDIPFEKVTNEINARIKVTYSSHWDDDGIVPGVYGYIEFVAAKNYLKS